MIQSKAFPTPQGASRGTKLTKAIPRGRCVFLSRTKAASTLVNDVGLLRMYRAPGKARDDVWDHMGDTLKYMYTCIIYIYIQL